MSDETRPGTHWQTCKKSMSWGCHECRADYSAVRALNGDRIAWYSIDGSWVFRIAPPAPADTPPPAAACPNLAVLLAQWEKRAGVTLPVDSAERKLIPIQTGHGDYFPAAIAAIAAWSAFNNEKHNPGQPLHWSQHKSSDHPDCMARHTVDLREASDKLTRLIEATARAWRANGELQMLAQEFGAPLAPGARAPADYARPNTGNHPDHPPVEGGYRGTP